jgi:hypothetical protein
MRDQEGQGLALRDEAEAKPAADTTVLALRTIIDAVSLLSES